MCGFPVKHAGCCDVARRRNDAVDPESPLSLQNCKVTFVGGPLAGASPSASKLAAYRRLLVRFYGERGCQRAGQSPKNFPTHKIFLPHIPGLGAEVFHPFNSGPSLFPIGEQTKPILSFGGIDRSWASSRDESLKERFDSSSPPVGFWGLLNEYKSSRSAISRPRPLHQRRSVGGLLQRFATWRNLLAVSSSDRAYKESPGRVSDRERSPDLGLGRRLLSHSHPLETAKNLKTFTLNPEKAVETRSTQRTRRRKPFWVHRRGVTGQGSRSCASFPPVLLRVLRGHP